VDEQFRAVLDAYGPSLSRLAASYTTNSSERDDLVQEIVLAVWRAMPRFRGESSQRTFFFRIAQNRAISFIAHRRAQAGLIEDASHLTDRLPSPEATASRVQETDRLLAAVQRLPLSYRQVVVLALEDLDYGETAEILGISESNVGARLTRARQLLRQMLEVSK
jgi:RNA polymerase sigma-70 factor (ECF subfamily)